MYFVYMVRCEDESLYTGTAADLARRMREHKARTALCAKYTRSHPVTALEAAWQAETRSDALRLEALIKRLPRTRKLALAAAPETLDALLGEKLCGASFKPLSSSTLQSCF